MKKLAFLFASLAVGFCVTLAYAAPRNVGTAFGANAASFGGGTDGGLGPYAGQLLLVQCADLAAPYTGQVVWIRASCPGRADGGSTCQNDAGNSATANTTGDIIYDFSVSRDPLPFKLGANEDRVYVRQTDAGTVACGFYTP